MAHLFNRNVLLGVSGGIAAYKSAELVRQLQELGANVRVIMTRGAQEFITPLTLQALSGNPVHTELLDEHAEMGMGHIELGRWADLLLIAPATADIVARLSIGRADDLLSTVALATVAPLMLAPAMNQQMWSDPATTANIETLSLRGAKIVGPASGQQACGDVGLGRMEQPNVIASAAASLFENNLLAGQRIVITAGPTREPLDPVRYISNNSSGKMGYALAAAAVDAGAITTLVSGPVNLAPPEHVRVLNTHSAEHMLGQCIELLPECDIFISCAAVADYRPAEADNQKIKKTQNEMTLLLVRNPDIVSAVAASKHRPYTVGFAAETNNVVPYAKEKMQQKGLDMMIANDVSDQTIGFNSDNNAVTVLWRDGETSLELASKTSIAQKIMHLIAQQTPKND
ncbi:MAG: bifunctional phosphopantothenoylcysteine decarboxylase/phosphopantothenate--cysteine ligase CoaBC [Halioglobus sp.]|nr:bifunctional phosphopantothenoylcysteine decarboxylase/phosphopantothenate--cysteine ligase CoaBC [Halioglobus sp.]